VARPKKLDPKFFSFTFALDIPLRERIAARARRLGISASALVREALLAHLSTGRKRGPEVRP
jgi:hypothetical protein